MAQDLIAITGNVPPPPETRQLAHGHWGSLPT
jgi:hypothetical protein